MPDNTSEDDKWLMLDSIFPVSSYLQIITISSHIFQEFPHPPLPEPTIAVNKQSVINDPTTHPWSMITVWLVGSYPHQNHYLCATFPQTWANSDCWQMECSMHTSAIPWVQLGMCQGSMWSSLKVNFSKPQTWTRSSSGTQAKLQTSLGCGLVQVWFGVISGSGPEPDLNCNLWPWKCILCSFKADSISEICKKKKLAHPSSLDGNHAFVVDKIMTYIQQKAIKIPSICVSQNLKMMIMFC